MNKLASKIDCKYFAKSENVIWLMEFQGDFCFCVNCLPDGGRI